MSPRRILQAIAGGAVLLVSAFIATPGIAQHHGGHGGHGGHFGGHGGHFGGHGGHYGGHHGVHVNLGHHGVHLGVHHGGGHYYDHHESEHHVNDHHYWGHHWPFHFGIHVGPWYGWYDDPYYDFYSPVVVGRVVQVVGEPVVAADEAFPAPAEPRGAPTTTAEGLAYKRHAEQSFRAGKYDESLRYANHALVEMPRDGELYLFTAQALFAVGDYRSAAAAIHQGVSLLDSQEWGRVVEDYRRYYRGRAFVDQMGRLNDYLEKNPDAAFARFVRGYEYGFLGHEKTAIRDLTKALELESRDELAARLLARFGGTVPERASNPLPANKPADSPNGHNHNGQNHEGHDYGSDDAEAQLPAEPQTPSAPRLLADLATPVAVDDAPGRSNSQTKKSRPRSVVPKGLAKLSASDRAAALAQRTCPITGDVLGRMGKPIKVRIGDREVFVCCQGCVEDLKSDRQTYLAQLRD